MRREAAQRAEAEALEELLDTPGWALYERRLSEALEKARADLEAVQSWEEYLGRRGKIDLLKVVLEMPRRMLKEARGG